MKRKMLAIVLVVLILIGVWYVFLGGRDYIETGVLGQEAVAVEMTVTHGPVTGSPLKNMTITVEARAYRTRVSRTMDLTSGPTQKTYRVRAVSGDKAAEYGAQVQFEKNITVYNATDYVVFQRTMTFDKGTDKVVTIYGTLEELRPCTDVTIVVDIYMKLTLPTPTGLGPSIVQVTIQKEISTHITE